MLALSDIYVLLPAFNEGERIQEVIFNLRKQGIENIIVVNDGSADDTASKARAEDVIVLDHYVNRGAGAAIQTGILLARQQGWNYIALMDADGQHDARDIFNLQRKMANTQCDIVIGSRFLSVKGQIPLTRIAFNFIANLMTNLFCKKNYSDSQSGLRLLNRQAIEKLDLRIDGFGFCSEMLIKAEKVGLQVEETPTKVLYTEYSLSKGQDFQMGINTAFNFLWNTLFK